MKEVSIHVGQRIRLYRKTKNLTIETFAGMIHKSKATVSKYENGDISIDIETLFTIAQALGVPVNQLIDYEEIGEEKGEKGEIIKHNLSKSKFSANMYASLEDLSNYYQCKLLYHGTMRKGDTFINFNFENQNNKVERMFMYAINSFNNGGRMEGLCCCLSTQPILPACFKFLMVSDILEETDDLKEKLKVSKEDIRLLKKMNMFVVSDHA